MNIPVHAGNDPAAQADGNSAGLLRDMIYHGGSTTIGAGLVLTLSNLVPGATYSFRCYYRSWGTGATARTITVQADGGHHGVFSDTLDVEIDAGGAHYLDYTYTTDDADVTIRFLTNDNNNGVHLYGFTNELMRGPAAAQCPSPANKATDVYRAATLGWTPGETAATHDVYFGTSAADVKAASGTTPLGVLASAGQSAITLRSRPAATLARPTTGASMRSTQRRISTIFKGGVWSFTVEPVSYPIAGTKITATASSSSSRDHGTREDDRRLRPERRRTSTRHGWRADVAQQHRSARRPPGFSTRSTRSTSWTSMLVWNSNQMIESLIGFGAKDVTIEYSDRRHDLDDPGRFRVRPGHRRRDLHGQYDRRFRRGGGQVRQADDQQQLGRHGQAVRPERSPLPPDPGGRGRSEPRLRSRGPGPARRPELAARREAGTHQVYLGTDAANLPLGRHDQRRGLRDGSGPRADLLLEGRRGQRGQDPQHAGTAPSGASPRPSPSWSRISRATTTVRARARASTRPGSTASAPRPTGPRSAISRPPLPSRRSSSAASSPCR